MSFGLYGVHDFDIKGSLYDGSISVENNKLANRQYVLDAVAAGGGEWFSSVLAQQDAPPSTPSTGDRYLVGSSGSGDWAALSNAIVEWDGSAWDSTAPDVGTPTAGAHVYIEGGASNAGNTMIYRTSPSAGWVVAASASGALLKTQNLSDLENVSDARSNLGLGDLAVEDSINLGGSFATGTLPVSKGGTGSSSAPMIGLVTAADAAAARTAIGAGSIATQDSDAVSITGGSISGITDLAVADGGTGASSASDARDNLGLTIGSDVQAHSDLLDDISGLTVADGTFLVGDANGDITAESGATARTSLGLGSVAVKDVGTARSDIVQVASALTSALMTSVEIVEHTTLTFNSTGSNWNYVYAGSSWSGPNSSSGTIVSKTGDTTSGTLVISYSQGGSYDFSSSGGDTLTVDDSYSFTTTTASSESITGLTTLTQSEVKDKIGNASSGADASSAFTGVASFDSAAFSVTSGFVSLSTGLSAGNIAKMALTASAGDLVKAVSLTAVSSGSLISSGAVDTSARTVKTQTNVSAVVAGQTFEADAGYSFEIQSVSSDGGGTPTYTITVADPSSQLQYLYNSMAFSIPGGDGFESAGAAGSAANVDVATSDGSSAQGKVLKVSSGATLSANDLLAIDASGNIIAGSAGEQGTVTSISLSDDDGDATSAITTSGSISVIGDGTVVTTDVNGSGDLVIAVADATTSTKGVVQKATSSTHTGDAVFVGFDAAVSSSSLGAGLMPLINGDGEISFDTTSVGFYKNSGSSGSFTTLDGHDLEGPLVKSSTGILDGSASLPATVSALEGAYIYDLSSAASDVSLNLPLSHSAADIGSTVTFKVQGLASGKKLSINGGEYSGGYFMTIDGEDSIDVDQARQSITLHLSAVMDSATPSASKLCWSIL